MATRRSIAELLGSGIRLTAPEAVAIARAALTCAPASPGTAAEPVDVPATTFIEPDGSIVYCGAHAPAIGEVARLLKSLLPEGSPGVPGGLRYAIARALHEVDAPPFGSPDEFLNTLARFQTVAAPDVMEGRRGPIDSHETSRPRVPIERRRPQGATVTNLRYALREADSRLYKQQRSSEAAPTQAARPFVGRRTAVIVAGIAAGILIFAAGVATRDHLAPAPVLAPDLAPGLAEATATSVPPPADIVLEPPVRKTAVVKVKAQPGARAVSRKVADKESKNRGFFQRMHLQWLRKAFS